MDAFNALYSATGELLRKYLKGRPGVPVEARMRILRLIENMTLGRNAVGYLTESMHGAGSPQAQRIQIGRQMEVDYKKQLAKRLAGADSSASPSTSSSPRFRALAFPTARAAAA